jgi:protoheme IX farnesyltransferase
MKTSITRFRNLVLLSAILIYALIVLGGIVRFTQSGGACPDWPTCLGQWLPPNQVQSSSLLLDYLHRVGTLLAGVPVLISAVLSWTAFRHEGVSKRALSVGAGILVLQIAVGAIVSVFAIPEGENWISAIHLALSLLLEAAVILAVVTLFFRAAARELTGLFHLRSSFARLSAVLGILVFILLVSGAIVSRSGAAMDCSSWPVCIPQTLAGWLSMAHRGLVGLTGILVLIMFWQAWHTQRSDAPILVSSTAVTVLFFSQALLGSKLVAGYPEYLLVLHQATASAVWAAMIVQLAAVVLSGRTSVKEALDLASARQRRIPVLLKDFLLLTKPIVVVLLLVTTFAGMVIGSQKWPPFWLTLWTLLGGFMAAGGSGAINQYIDRYDDEKMQRTQKRPIPSGRMTPAEGLAFGVGLLLASFFLLVAFVNLLAALLSLAGMIYYVLIYSIFLKKTTVQNIVIGGGAGAIPPLVGWAAATGNLNIPSLLLFGVVFMWTPPHFWALALVRRNDYARAGVPMLPVVRGESETRWQIFIYTVELVALTLALPLFGLGGSVYLVGALILGAWLLMAAWKVWRQGGNKIAWKMYRYSSMYLAFIFFILMIDRLL